MEEMREHYERSMGDIKYLMGYLMDSTKEM